MSTKIANLLTLRLGLNEKGQVLYSYDRVSSDDLLNTLNEKYPEDECIPEIVTVHKFIQGYLDELNNRIEQYYKEEKPEEEDDPVPV